MYEIIEQGQRMWAVDWELVRLIIYGNDFWSAVPQYRTVKNSFVDSPCLTICLEDRTYDTYSTDFVKVREHAERSASQQLRGFAREVDRDVTFLVDQLSLILEDTRLVKQEHLTLINGADRRWRSSQTAATAESESDLRRLKRLRDASAEFVVVGSTIVTGGATAVGFAALGSGMKATATYQDTGSAGAAVFEATTTMLVTAVPLARGGASRLSGTDKAVIVTLEANFEAAKAVLAGDELEQAVAKGALKAVTSQTDKLIGPMLKNGVVRDMMSHASLPSKVSVSAGSDAAIDSLDLVGSMATWTANSQFVTPYASGIIDSKSPQERVQIRERLAAIDTSTVACHGTLESCADAALVRRAVFPVGCVATN